MGGQWAELKGYSQRKYLQGESWKTTLYLAKPGQKAACQKTLQLKKELLTLSPGDVTEVSC
jgi:hypothetical protein